MHPLTRAQENLDDIRRQLDEAKQHFDTLKMKLGESFRDFEYRTKSLSDKILSLKVAEEMQLEQIRQEAREAEKELLKKKLLIYEEESSYRIRGWRKVRILFLGGLEVSIVARLFATNKSRHEKGKGYYPGLVLFGICEQLSPATRDLIAKSAAALGSMRDAKESLADQGIHVSLARISTCVRAVAFQARRLRGHDISLKTLEMQGRKIVVSVDGGRIRIRIDRKKKSKKNRKRYSTPWKEPKLLCIYFLDENGNVDRTTPPILDGTMAHVDEIFKMLCDYLSMIPMDSETQVLYVSDGATCLWKRVALVKKKVEDKGAKFYCLLDYYHMKGYLHDIANAVKDWTKKERKQWLALMTGYLFDGDSETFKRGIKAIHKISKAKSKLRTWCNYLLKHLQAGHMNYGEMRQLKLPIGSGVIESTVRRVVNLRLKGASVYWKHETAEDMLLLRCFYKANRWQSIEKQGVAIQFSTAKCRP